MRSSCTAWRSRVLLLVSSLAALAGCGRTNHPPNLLLVTLDTTRADRLGAYGYGGAETPNLDRLAREGARFEQAIAVAPLTLPSHASLFTGHYPPRHGVRVNGDFRLPEGETTLAEALAAHGYRTAAVVAAFVLSADFGLAQGFAVYDEPHEPPSAGAGGNTVRFQEIVERKATTVTDAGLALVEGQLEEPFFLWLHYYDPHAEYTPPEPYASRFAGRAYDGELAYVDAELGRVLEALRARGVLDHTLVAVTADHGESLDEHGETTHGLFVYDSTLRVPLVLRLPGVVPAGLVSRHLVSGVDLAPTLLELLGQAPLAAGDGLSFAGVARGGTESPREAVYAESELSRLAYGWAPLHALRDEHFKYVAAPQLELYDLAADPGETKNVAVDRLGDAGRFVQKLAALEASWPAERPPAALPLSAEAQRKLSALGYVGGTATRPTAPGELPNPRRLAPVHNLLLDAQTLVARGAGEAALVLVEKALAVDPQNPAALELGGMLQCSTGRAEAGLERLTFAAHLAPRSYQTQRNLGNALHLVGRYVDAAAAFRAAIALHPAAPEAHHALGRALYAAGDAPGAVASFEEALRLGLDTAQLEAALGVARAAKGDLEGARTALERAVALDATLGAAWNQLGIVAEKEGRLDDARASYLRALEQRPDDADARFNAAKVALRQGQVELADADLERLIKTSPGYPTAPYLEAQIRLAQGNKAAARRALERFIAQKGADPRLVASARQTLHELGGS